MDKEPTSETRQTSSSKIFLLVFFLILLVSVGATYYKMMIKRDYILSVQIDCDPYSEECFIDDSGEDTWYYKVLNKKAYNIPECDPNQDEDCVIACEENEKDCEEVLCSEETVEEGGECVDPVAYAEENPIEEEDLSEEAECEEGDEECLEAEAGEEAEEETASEEADSVETMNLEEFEGATAE